MVIFGKICLKPISNQTMKDSFFKLSTAQLLNSDLTDNTQKKFKQKPLGYYLEEVLPWVFSFYFSFYCKFFIQASSVIYCSLHEIPSIVLI